MRASLSLIALTLVLLLGSAGIVDACSCMTIGPPCQAFWGADAVLDATVVSITPPAPADRTNEGDRGLWNNPRTRPARCRFRICGAAQRRTSASRRRGGSADNWSVRMAGRLEVSRSTCVARGTSAPGLRPEHEIHEVGSGWAF